MSLEALEKLLRLGYVVTVREVRDEG